jgi:hypothetical protein
LHVNISFLNLVAVKFKWISLLKKILRGDNSIFTLDDYDWNKKITKKIS